MNRWVRYSALVFLALLCASGNCFGNHNPKVETRLRQDSTIFTMELVKNRNPEVGKTFKVKVHVNVLSGWRVWSSTMTDDGGMIPLTLAIPDSLSDYFEISKITELSDIHFGYDSNFMVETKAVFQPFDVIVTIKVKRNTPKLTQFSLLARYQAVTSKYCMPPMLVPIPMSYLGQKPIILKIAGARKRTKMT